MIGLLLHTPRITLYLKRLKNVLGYIVYMFAHGRPTNPMRVYATSVAVIAAFTPFKALSQVEGCAGLEIRHITTSEYVTIRNNNPRNAADGLAETIWRAKVDKEKAPTALDPKTAEQFIIFDTGAAYPLCSIEIKWVSRTDNYKIEVSQDKVSWIPSVISPVDKDFLTILDLNNFEGRYVKVTGIGRFSIADVSINGRSEAVGAAKECPEDEDILSPAGAVEESENQENCTADTSTSAGQ